MIRVRNPILILSIIILIICISSHGNHQHSHENQHKQYDEKVQKIVTENQQKLTQQTDQQKIARFFTSCEVQVGQWISLPNNTTLDRALNQCKALQNASHLLNFYKDLSNIGEDMSRQHIDGLPKLFRKYKPVAQILKCLSQLRQFENKYLSQKKKLKYLLQFIKAHPEHSKNVFPKHNNFTLIGQKTCYFMKVLFEYYYVEIVSSMQSLSTSFIRALTLRSDVFDHYDISYCVSLQTIGKLSDSLEDMDINNIFIKVPQVYNHLRFLKLKEKCKDETNLKMVRNLQNKLQGIDMFKVMYSQYEPYVDIAAQKFGHTQIRLLARQFAMMLNNRQKYLEISKQNNQSEQKQL